MSEATRDALEQHIKEWVNKNHMMEDIIVTIYTTGGVEITSHTPARDGNG